MNPKKFTSRPVVIKLLKTKEKEKNNLKAVREKWYILYKGTTI